MSVTNASYSFPKNLPSLTSCRFFAALCVMAHHFHGPWPGNIFEPIGDVGWMGVYFFFALSGFVLMWSFDRSETKKHFYIQRLSRIYPLHFLCLIIAVVYFFVYRRPLAGYIGSKLSILASLFLMHDWIPGHPEIGQAWNGVSWSLSCEFLYYLLAPFLFMRWLASDARRELVKLSVIWLIVFALSWMCGLPDMELLADILRLHPLPHLIEFSLGAVLALRIRNHPEIRINNVGLFFWIIPLIAYCCTSPGTEPYDMGFAFLAIPGFLFLIVTLAQRDMRGQQSFLHHPILLLLGESSFALYMTHALILGSPFSADLSKFFSFIHHKQIFLTACITVYVTTCIVVSVIVHKWIEIPARRWIIRNAM